MAGKRLAPPGAAHDEVSLRLSNTHPQVNLTLRVGSRRDDGYHDIESLVVFAQRATA